MTTLGIDLQDNGTAACTQFMRDDLARYTDGVKRMSLSGGKPQ